ncbi:MAG: efflux RND transporter periplasmic adaptor subunit, partial [Planctomycetales bacterium]|nr:efflux RND transporter periplasmic adaptor subunit [Planctomycetales bacterium]
QTDARVAAARLATDERRVAVAESQRELLEVRLQDMVVRAPYEGRVVTRHSEPGEWIKPGEPIVTLVSSGRIEAWLNVPERYSQSIDQQRVSVVATGVPDPIEPLSTKVVSDFDVRTRTFPLVLTLDDQQGRLASGMSVGAWLPVGKYEHRLAVPKDAVIRSGRTAYVYKAVDQQGSTLAVQTPISIAYETGDAMMLAGGDLSEGDRVVVEGNERLLPGMPITVAVPAENRLSADRQYVTADKR